MKYKIEGDLRRYGKDQVGKGLVNPERTKFWLDIPKNASQTTIDGLAYSHDPEAKWHRFCSQYDDANQFHKYVILRDPVERWIGSSVELWWHHHIHNPHSNNFLSEKNLREWWTINGCPDLHHVPQWAFARHLDLDENTTFIFMDGGDIREKLRAIFDGYRFKSNVNFSPDNEKKVQYKYKILDEFISDPQFVNRIKEYYADDYELISKYT